MKPTFLFFGGIGWCGTTSLFYTLRDNGYLHTGYKKENRILHRIQEWENWGFLEPERFHNDPRFCKLPVRQEVLTDVRAIRNGHPPRKDWLACLGNLKQSTEDMIMKPLVSLEEYVEFYKELSNTGRYESVGDFSNPNAFLSENNLIKVKQALEPHFNIKSLIILRDPIRRLFSNINSNVYSNHITNLDFYKNKKTDNATKVFEEFIDKVNIHNTYHYYDYLINTFKKVFGSVHYIIMEDFFKEKSEVEKLEKYIDYQLPVINPCCFVPDRGINAPKLPNLEDQWDSDHEVLTNQLYTIAREKLSDIYTKFEILHGHLPADWGKPITYS